MYSPGEVQASFSPLFQLVVVQYRFPTLMTTGSALPPAPDIGGLGWGRGSPPLPMQQQDRREMGELFHSQDLRADSPTPELTMLALFRCPVEAQGLLC